MVPHKSAISCVAILLIVLATFAAYSQMPRAGFIWDDESYVQDNPVYTLPHPLSEIWFNTVSTPQYYPLVFTVLYAERLAWGLQPAGYHIINVLIHAGSAVLLWLVLKRLRVPAALLAAGVFALHPIMVESVAWVTELKNTLSTLLFLASLLTFLKFSIPRTPGSDAAAEWRKWAWYALSLVIFVLALLSKSVVVGLAPVLVLLTWWKHWGKTSYLATIPYFILGVTSGLFTAYLEKTHVGATGQAWQLSLVDKILLAGRAIWFYFGKLLFPARLSFYYTRWDINPAVWWQWLFPIGIIAVLVALWLARKRIGLSAFVAALAFIALMFPALGFFAFFPMIFSWVADHFAYLGALAFIPAVCAALAIAANRLRLSQSLQNTLAVAVLVMLGSKTYLITGNYLSPEALWQSVLAYDPEHPHWNALLGMSNVLHKRALEQQTQGKLAEAAQTNEDARAYDEKALSIRPDYPAGLYGLAVYYQFRGDNAQALAESSKAIALDPNDARFYSLQARVYLNLQQTKPALDAITKALALNNRSVPYRLLSAQIQMDAGQYDAAQREIETALVEDANSSDAHMLLGLAYARTDRLNDALQEFQRAVADDPASLDAQDNLSRLVAILPASSQPQIQQARAGAQRNVEVTGGKNPAYIDTLAMVLHRAGDDAHAIALLRDSLQSGGPADEQARANMRRHLAAWAAAAPATTTRP